MQHPHTSTPTNTHTREQTLPRTHTHTREQTLPRTHTPANTHPPTITHTREQTHPRATAHPRATLTCRGCTLHQGMAHVPADAEREHTRPSDLELPLHGCDDGIRVAHLAIRQQEDLWYRVDQSKDSTTTSSLFSSDNNPANEIEAWRPAGRKSLQKSDEWAQVSHGCVSSADVRQVAGSGRDIEEAATTGADATPQPNASNPTGVAASLSSDRACAAATPAHTPPAWARCGLCQSINQSQSITNTNAACLWAFKKLSRRFSEAFSACVCVLNPKHAKNGISVGFSASGTLWTLFPPILRPNPARFVQGDKPPLKQHYATTPPTISTRTWEQLRVVAAEGHHLEHAAFGQGAQTQLKGALRSLHLPSCTREPTTTFHQVST